MIPIYVRPNGHLSPALAHEPEPTDEEFGWCDDEPIDPDCEEDEPTT